MDGFRVPIHRSLTQVILIAGVPREIAILYGTLTAALVLGLHSFWGIPVGILVHMLAVPLSKHDPQFFETFRRQIRQRGIMGIRSGKACSQGNTRFAPSAEEEGEQLPGAAPVRDNF